MKNPATHIYRDQLNEFTNIIAANHRFGSSTLVRLRNNTLVEVIYKPAKHETEEDVFFTEDYKYCWNLDGTSVTRRDYDMMELV